MNVYLSFWIKENDSNFLGKGKITLLKHINQTGSLSKAAKIMKMSYKAAWDDIQSINRIAPQVVVETNTGGKNGGGSKISAYGLELIEAFETLEEMIALVEQQMQGVKDAQDLKNRVDRLKDKLDSE